MRSHLLVRRRSALLGLAASVTFGRSSMAVAARATPRDARFVVVILRGALDGMAAVTPYGDPGLSPLRAALLPGEPGQAGGLLDLGGFYGLHPALTGLHALYARGEMMPVHAVAAHYRSRSHFEAQDYLESGADQRLSSGWLNRVVGVMPATRGPDGDGLAVGLSVPLLLRGPTRIGSYAPAGAHRPDPDLYQQIAALNRSDPVTGPAFRAGLRAQGFSDAALGTPGTPSTAGAAAKPGSFALLAQACGRLLAAPDGPRIAALEAGGWDTHADQKRRLVQPLRQLDDGLIALRDGLGDDAWRRTVVLVMTEFGRTARINGTGGTDHGTATVAFLLGGAVRGGRVAGTWPGLAGPALFENRDLAPTTDVRSVALGVLQDHLAIPPSAHAMIFPGPTASPMRGLVAA